MEPHNAKRRDALKMLAALGAAAGTAPYSYAQPNGTQAVGDGTVFENDRVRVVRRLAAPGQDVYAAEPQRFPRLALFMTDAKVKTSASGRDMRVDYKLGALVWSAGDAGPAANAGGVETMVYLIEPNGTPPAAADDRNGTQHAKGPPPNVGGRIMLDNAWMRVIEHAARPRMGVCGMSMHTHPPHLTIALTGGRIKIEEPGKEPVIRETKSGLVFWDDAGPHAITNLGSRDTRALLIEFKRA